jgi:lipopolysaccharide export system protein LptC
MENIKQAYWLFLSIFALAIAGWYFAGAVVSLEFDPRTLANVPDLIIDTLSVEQYNTEGKLINSLQTPHSQHTPNKDKHLLQNPYIVITQPNQPAWEITAETATITEHGQKVILKHNVLVHQPQSPDTAESTFITESITYFPKTQTAHTKKAITFTQPGHTIKAIGMEANLAEKSVRLLSHTRGYYEPAKG